MNKNPRAETEINLKLETEEEKSIREIENSRVIIDPKEVKEYLRSLYEDQAVEEEQTRQFDKDIVDEVSYYRHMTVEAKTSKELRKIETLIKNRISISDEIPELKATRKKFKGVLSYCKSKLREKKQSESDSTINGIFQPKINEEIIEDLFVKLSSYFEPKDQFVNFLTGNQIEGKINFMAKQNKLSGIFIDLKSNEDIVLGTHQQTFDFIKQTFLIEGEPIESKQILRYLKEPAKAKPETFIDISI